MLITKIREKYEMIRKRTGYPSHEKIEELEQIIEKIYELYKEDGRIEYIVIYFNYMLTDLLNDIQNNKAITHKLHFINEIKTFINSYKKTKSIRNGSKA